MPRGELELAVRDRSLLERPEAPHPIVRLPEHELSEQTDRDEQQRGADERDQQLRPDRDRHASDGPDEWVADPPGPLGGGPKQLLLRQVAQTSSTVEPPIMFVISHDPPIRATSMSAAVTDTTSPVFVSM